MIKNMPYLSVLDNSIVMDFERQDLKLNHLNISNQSRFQPEEQKFYSYPYDVNVLQILKKERLDIRRTVERTSPILTI